MAISAVGGSGSSQASGGRRTLDWYAGIAGRIDSNFFSGGVPPVATRGIIRGGFDTAGLFPVGSNGPNGIANNSDAGRPHLFFSPGVAIRDQFCIATMQIPIKRPIAAVYNPWQVWECEADVILRLPGGVIANDLGMILHCDTATTGYGADFTGGGGAFSQGLALMAQGATNEIRALARGTNGVGFGVNVGTGVIAQAPGAATDTFRRLKIRVEGATVAADPQVTYWVDGVLKHTIALTPGNVNVPNLNIIPPAGAQQWLGAFRPFLRNGGNNASGAVFAYSYWRVSAAASVADMDA